MDDLRLRSCHHHGGADLSRKARGPVIVDLAIVIMSGLMIAFLIVWFGDWLDRRISDEQDLEQEKSEALVNLRN